MPPSRGGLGVYLGVVQFFFTATWIVCVIYLPPLISGSSSSPTTPLAWPRIASAGSSAASASRQARRQAEPAVPAAGWPQSPAFGDALAWWPVAGWLAASVGVVVLIARRTAQPA